ncbi:hypothetical protein BGZ63DRAFT_373027 [Mariannaea sp. PMI_226]|nr:hypothetical protein BGZ63DRAFT_373027 [Mariannaea sp. PMI_226]
MVVIAIATLFSVLAITQTAASSCLPAHVKCGMEGKLKGLSGLKPFGTFIGADNSFQCWEYCTDAHRASRCVSFGYTESEARCTVYDFSINTGMKSKAGTGTYFWDLSCWKCGVSN